MTARRAPAISRDTLETMLVAGAKALDVALTDTQRNQLLDYVALLGKWNAVYNLTAIRDPQQMLIQHILDSLSIVPHLRGRGPIRVLDVGSGGGLPGIVLAIVFPEWQVTLNDIVQKKSAKVISSAPDPTFGFAGVELDTMRCSACGHEERRQREIGTAHV